MKRQLHFNEQEQKKIYSGRQAVIRAFKKLRKLGYIAKANYLCCMNCATTAIWDDYSSMPDSPKKEKLIGVVYWHRQNEQNIWEQGILYLGFGELDDKVKGEILGAEIVKVLKTEGLAVKREGNPDVKILVEFLKSNVPGCPKCGSSDLELSYAHEYYYQCNKCGTEWLVEEGMKVEGAIV
mgnify:CR=1 FL=1